MYCIVRDCSKRFDRGKGLKRKQEKESKGWEQCIESIPHTIKQMSSLTITPKLVIIPDIGIFIFFYETFNTTIYILPYNFAGKAYFYSYIIFT